MTEDHTTPDRRTDLVTSDPDHRPISRADWERVPPDPDVEADLEYDLAEWERIETTDGTDTHILLPAVESEIRDDSFIVVADEALVDLPGHR